MLGDAVCDPDPPRQAFSPDGPRANPSTAVHESGNETGPAVLAVCQDVDTSILLLSITSMIA